MKTKRLVRVFDKTETCKILMEAEAYIVDTPGTFYELIVTPKKATRNKDQNNLYWGLVDTITHWMNDTHDLGWTNQETHQFLKYEFFSDRDTILDAVQAIQGGEITTTQFLTIVDNIIQNTTTTDKDVGEFAEIITNIIKHFRGLGLELSNNLPPIDAYEELID